MAPARGGPRIGLPRISLPQLWLGLAVLLPGLASLLSVLSTVDLAYGLRAGGEILDGAGIPRTDTYTFTVAGQPWLDQQWGAQVFFAAWWRALGWSGLVLLRAVLISAAWACLVVAIRQRAPGLGARTVAALALLAFMVTAPAMALRPQLVGILLFCLVLALLAGRHRHPRLAWAVPLVVLAWANVHGSFVLGPALAGLGWLEDVRLGGLGRGLAGRSARSGGRPFDLALGGLALAVVTGLATLVTPFGPGALAYALTLSSNRELAARISEWQPPSPADPTGLLFFGSVVLVAVIVVLRRGVVRWPTVAGLALFAALGLIAARGVAWWPAAAVTMVAPLVPWAAPYSPFRRAPRVNALNTLILVLLVVVLIPLLRVGAPADPKLGMGAPAGLLGQAPAAVTGVLREWMHSGEDLQMRSMAWTPQAWAPQTWGSWLELAVPDLPVAVDSRIELFPADLWADYDTVADARPGWQAILERREATLLVVAGTQEALLAAARSDAGWREIPGGDATGTVFVTTRSATP